MVKLPYKHISPELIQEHLSFWQAMSNAWDRCDILPDDDLTTIVFKTYFRVQNVTKMYEVFKANGIGNFKTTTQISDILREGHIADKELEKLTKIVQERNGDWSTFIPSGS